MSTAEILSLISLISYITSGVCLVLAIVFFFVFRIPAVVGDLSGRTARKSIARMRASNEQAGGQGYKPSITNAQRGKLTADIIHAGKMTTPAKKKTDTPMEPKPEVDNGSTETGLLAENRAELSGGQETMPLDEEEATGLLLDPQETVKLQDVEETALLSDDEAAAVQEKDPVHREQHTGGKKLSMVDDVMLIHTDEVLG